MSRRTAVPLPVPGPRTRPPVAPLQTYTGPLLPGESRLSLSIPPLLQLPPSDLASVLQQNAPLEGPLPTPPLRIPKLKQKTLAPAPPSKGPSLLKNFITQYFSSSSSSSPSSTESSPVTFLQLDLYRPSYGGAHICLFPQGLSVWRNPGYYVEKEGKLEQEEETTLKRPKTQGEKLPSYPVKQRPEPTYFCIREVIPRSSSSSSSASTSPYMTRFIQEWKAEQDTIVNTRFHTNESMGNAMLRSTLFEAEYIQGKAIPLYITSLEKRVYTTLFEPADRTAFFVGASALLHTHRIRISSPRLDQFEVLRLLRVTEPSDAPLFEHMGVKTFPQDWWILDVACEGTFYLVLLRSRNATKAIYQVRMYAYMDPTDPKALLYEQTWDQPPPDSLVLYCRMSTTLPSPKPLLYWTPINFGKLGHHVFFEPRDQIHVLDTWKPPSLLPPTQLIDSQLIDTPWLEQLQTVFLIHPTFPSLFRRFILRCIQEYKTLQLTSSVPFPLILTLDVELVDWCIWSLDQSRKTQSFVDVKCRVKMTDWILFLSILFKEKKELQKNELETLLLRQPEVSLTRTDIIFNLIQFDV